MKINDILKEGDNFDLSPQQRKIANLGRVLMDQATTTKDDALANLMAKVGNELTNFGATFGPKNLKDLSDKTDVPPTIIQKLLSYAQKIESAKANLNKDHKDGGLNDSIAETTSAGSVAAVVGGVGSMQSRNMYNANGTMKNALDQDNLLSNGKPKSNKKSKKA
jgi:hypothetical protein